MIAVAVTSVVAGLLSALCPDTSNGKTAKWLIYVCVIASVVTWIVGVPVTGSSVSVPEGKVIETDFLAVGIKVTVTEKVIRSFYECEGVNPRSVDVVLKKAENGYEIEKITVYADTRSLQTLGAVAEAVGTDAVYYGEK